MPANRPCSPRDSLRGTANLSAAADRGLGCPTPGPFIPIARSSHTLTFAFFLVSQVARFAHFFSVSTISRSSASLAELGLIVAFRIALRNT